MRADARSGPIGGRYGIDPRPALFNDTADELVYEVRMRTMMATALLERQVLVVLAIHEPPCETADRRR